MYTTGLLGQLNTMAAGLGNWVRAGALALGLSSMGASVAGCGSESGYGDGGIPPLGPPDGNDTTLPPTPENIRDTCLPADSSGVRFRLLVEGEGVRLGTGTPTDGSFYMSMPSGAFTLLSGASEGRIPFRGRLKWASPPSEWETVNPDDAIGPLALLTQARLDGQPLTHVNMTRAGLTGPWANQFAAFADRNRVGFLWPVEGVLHYVREGGQVTDCEVEMTVRSAARTSSGTGPALDYGVLSFYAPRADGDEGIAEANFGNETVVILNAPMDVLLPVTGEVQDVCDGDCTDVLGASNPSRVRIRLLRNAP
jgi:hypothetical protein